MLLQNILDINKKSVGKNYVDTLRNGHFSILFHGPQNNPAIYNYNGYSAFCGQGTLESESEQLTYLYNHSTETLEQKNWGNYPNGDYHSGANTLILNDGRVLTAAASIHNGEITIKRSVNPYDISSYNTLTAITTGLPTYFNMMLVNDRIYAVFRGEGTTTIMTAIYCTFSDDGGSTWFTPYKVMEYEDGDTRLYPRLVYNKDRIRLFVNRSNAAVTEFNSLFYLESFDGEFWTDITGNNTVNIFTDGFINASQLDNDYLIGGLGFINETCYASDIDTLMFIKESDLYYYSNSQWNVKYLRNDNYKNTNSVIGRAGLIYYGNNKFDLYANSENLSDQSIIIKITTEDFFDNYNYKVFDNQEFLDFIITPFNYEHEQNKFLAISFPVVDSGIGTRFERRQSSSDFNYYTTDLAPLKETEGTGVGLLLDNYPSKVAYSLRKLKSDVTNVIRVFADASSTERDFTADEIVDGTLVTWLNGSSGFIKVWYDQSGNDTHAIERAGTALPRIAFGGTIDETNGLPAVYFYSTRILDFTDTAVNSVFSVNRVTDSFSILNHLAVKQNESQGIFLGGTFYEGVDGLGVDINGNRININGQNANQKLGYWNYNGSNWFVSENGNVATGVGAGGSIELGTLGKRSTSQNVRGHIQEIIMFDTEQSANKTAIEADINSYYGVY